MIKVRNITKFYESLIAVDDVSFDIQNGEIVGLLGPNGAGKTTTMKIMTGYIPANKGEVSINGLDVFTHSLESRRLIGYLPENTPLYDNMNVYESLDFFADMHDLPNDKKVKQMKKIIEVCGLSEKVKSETSELSKGYRQRLGLAQALLHDPDILILDEPTSGLDPNQIVEIRNLIKTFSQEKTVIISTHILSEVEAVCGRVIIINKGKIVGQDTPSELKRKGSEGNSLYIEVEGSKKEITDILNKIEGITAIINLESSDRRIHSFKLSLGADLDLRKIINRTLLNNGLELLEMRKETASLEEVFRNLTHN